MKNVKQIPGWVITLVIIGVLYLTGLHTEVIGQVQRIILAIGLIKPHVEPAAEKGNLTGERSVAALPVADYNLYLRSLSGSDISLESLKGKVIFMNFWATWCPPCIAEMPNIQSLYKKVKSENIAFVMVSLDQDPAKAQQFVVKKGFSFPVYTPNKPLPSVYESPVIPTTYVISPDGHIVASKEGMANYDNPDFRKFLIQLSQQPEPVSR